jgi:hypothetical protein
MVPGFKEYRIAEMRRQEMLAEVERWRLARQIEGRPAAADTPLPSLPLPSLPLPLRYARYLLTSLAAVAFGLFTN